MVLRSPPGLSRTKRFAVNKTKHCDYKQKGYKQQKKNNIFILTVDNYYFIIEKKYLQNIPFFANLFQLDDSAGHLRNPIFLQQIRSDYFKYIIQYLKKYYICRDEKYEVEAYISVNNLYASYNSEWDKQYIREIYNGYIDNLESFEELLRTSHYMGMSNLYKKLKYCYDFIVNTKKYNLEELHVASYSDYEYDDERECESEEY